MGPGNRFHFFFIMSNNILQNEVVLDHESHIYTDSENRKYLSVSKFLDHFKEETDFDMLAGAVARSRKKTFEKMASDQNKSIKAISLLQPMYERGYEKKTVQMEWDKKRDVAIEHGSWIHSYLEKAGKTGIINEDPYSHYYEWFLKEYSRFKIQYYEQSVYYRDEAADVFLAGTMDFNFFRKGLKSMMCIRDFKTNDFTFDTMKYNHLKKEWKNYDRRLTGPLSHLEDTDYTKYCLQQSIYAYMCEVTFGYTIGNLAIIAMPWQKRIRTPRIHYVPYMKLEVQAMIKHYAENKTKNIIFDADDLIEEDYHETISL